MRQIRSVAVIIGICICLTGCVGPTYRSLGAEEIKALAGDTASWCFHDTVGTVYGTLDHVYGRAGQGSGTVTCGGQNGFSANSGVVTVPIVVTPQISVGQPTTK